MRPAKSEKPVSGEREPARSKGCIQGRSAPCIRPHSRTTGRGRAGTERPLTWCATDAPGSAAVRPLLSIDPDHRTVVVLAFWHSSRGTGPNI